MLSWGKNTFLIPLHHVFLPGRDIGITGAQEVTLESTFFFLMKIEYIISYEWQGLGRVPRVGLEFAIVLSQPPGAVHHASLSVQKQENSEAVRRCL